ncbi:O-antigen ligase family protein [Candidatus Woesebacteria bacterium]|nr:O-antigen ligase family protein [Candidatus Woesebacteria bacterium]
MKKLAIWALILCALVPLIAAPNLITYSVGGKITLIRGLAFLSIALITLAVLFGKQVEQRRAIIHKIATTIKNPLFIAVGLNIIFLALSTLFAHDSTVALSGEPFRMEGFITIFAFATMCLGMLAAFGKKEWNRYFLLTWIVSIVIVGVEMKQIAQGIGRPDSLLGNPLFLATYYIFSLFVSGLLFIKGRKEGKPLFTYGAILAAILFVIGIFFTNTRGTVFALGIGFFASLIALTMHGKNILLGNVFGGKTTTPFGKKTLRFLAGSLLGLVVVFTGVFIGTRKADFWQSIPGFDRLATTSINEGTAASRIKFTQVSLAGFFKDSDIKTYLVGWGWDNYVYFFQDNYDPQIYRYEENLADRAHNKLVDVLVMSGFLGLLTYLAIWFFLFKYSFKILKEKLSLGVLLLFFLVTYFVNNLFAFDTGVTYLALYSIIAFVIFTHLETGNRFESSNSHKTNTNHENSK